MSQLGPWVAISEPWYDIAPILTSEWNDPVQPPTNVVTGLT